MVLAKVVYCLYCFAFGVSVGYTCALIAEIDRTKSELRSSKPRAASNDDCISPQSASNTQSSKVD